MVKIKIFFFVFGLKTTESIQRDRVAVIYTMYFALLYQVSFKSLRFYCRNNEKLAYSKKAFSISLINNTAQPVKICVKFSFSWNLFFSLLKKCSFLHRKGKKIELGRGILRVLESLCFVAKQWCRWQIQVNCVGVEKRERGSMTIQFYRICPILLLLWAGRLETMYYMCESTRTEVEWDHTK